MPLEKAQLISKEASRIEFMFNPMELEFKGEVATNESTSARHQSSGTPKVSFSHIEAYTVTISNIMFDTYEEGTNVVNKYINKFKEAVAFAPGKERPPLYTFQWGSIIYLRRCFIEQLSYKLTMFLEDGTPVRAVIGSLTLKEADEEEENASNSTSNPSQSQRQAESRRRSG